MKNEFPKAHFQSSRRTARNRKELNGFTKSLIIELRELGGHRRSKPRRIRWMHKSLKGRAHGASRPSVRTENPAQALAEHRDTDDSTPTAPGPGQDTPSKGLESYALLQPRRIHWVHEKRRPHGAPRPRQEHSKSTHRASRPSRELRKSTRGASRQRRNLYPLCFDHKT